MTDTITITAEQIAAELKWRLSNSNAELETCDIAYDTYDSEDQGEATFLLNVQAVDLNTHARGQRRFIVRIEAV